MIYKKFLLIVLSSLILLPNLVEAKEFKSKNGYSFKVPKNHKVVEKNMMKLYDKHKDNEISKNMDEEMLKDTVDVNIKYLTWIIEKNEKEPDKYNISITGSKDVLLDPKEFTKEWCPEFEVYFDQMVTNKKINLYYCEKQNIVINNENKEVLKFVYDGIFPNTFFYHYMTIVNAHWINIAGSCLKENCSYLDQNLLNVSSSFNWN